MAPTVIMTFKAGHPTTIRVEGAAGETCRSLSQPFIAAIGGKITSDKPTAEMGLVTDEKETVTQGH